MAPKLDNLDSSPLSFERVALLAVSNMARVELCRVSGGERHGQLVAVKRLPASMAEEDEQRAMFRDEIWMTAALDHPNITKLLGWGEDDSGLYLAVEFVRGVSLARLWRTVLRTGEAFTERLVVYVASLICAGLEHAHALTSDEGEFLNLVHRDLTPGNILLSFEGDVKISDFGLAKAKQRVTSTAIGMTKGDPAYMSPEQVMGKELDGRSDIFTFGILLFELFAQRRPWAVNGVVDALEKIVNGTAPKLGDSCPKLDPALCSLVDRCLAREPEARFANVGEVKERLDEWLNLHGYDENRETLGRFVRRNAMRQMRWLDRALAGELRIDEIGPTPLELSSDEPVSLMPPPERASRSGPTDPTRASARAPAMAAMSESAPTSAVTQPRAASALPPPGSGRLPDHAKTTKRQRADTPAPHTRRRDAAPPLGAVHDSPVTLPPPPPGPTPPVREQGEEPSTLRRSPITGELHEIAARLRRDAERLAAEAGQAAVEARAAAERSESASRAAHVAAAAAQGASEALKHAISALELAAGGNVRAAVAEAHRARDIHAQIVGKNR